jgi:diaminopimelate epimerase
MEGAGNDYVYVDVFRETVRDASALAVRMSERSFGVGADGLILIGPSDKADVRMEMYNADGSRGEMCGNAVRCVAKYVYDRGIVRKDDLAIETDAGVKRLRVFTSGGKVQRVSVDMGAPRLDRAEIPMSGPAGRVIGEKLLVLGRTFEVTAVNMGNPHCVTFIKGVRGFDLAAYGPAIEHYPAFPKRVNAEFVEVENRTNLRMRVWERGSGETLACGTGACATTVAAVLNGLADRMVTVHLLGGDLEIEWPADGASVRMTGPAREVFSGEWPGSE